MKVEIVQQGNKHYIVLSGHSEIIGHIYDFSGGPFVFKYCGDNWKKLTFAENTAVLDAVKPKLMLLNITKRLQG